MKASKVSGNRFTWFVCMMAALSGLLFGLDIGVIAGALPFLAKDLHISNHEQEWVVSSMMFGAAIGALAAGWMSSKLGRKKSMLAGATLFIIGSLWSALSPDVESLIFSRVLLGLAVGVASYTAPLYLAEIAPERIRGSMISMYQLMLTTGIVVAYLSDTAFSYSGSWRWMLGVIAIPAVILFIGVLFLPNSPRWLASHGRFNEAQRVLDRLRNTSEQAKQELDDIRESLKVKQHGWSLFRNNGNFRRAVWLGMLLQLMQQFTGMNVVMYYAPKIFGIAGFSSTGEQMWGTVIVGMVNVLATLIAIGLVDRWGRKPMLTTSFLVMAIGMGVLGTLLHLGVETDFRKYFAIAMLLIFIVGFAMAAGPVVWLLCSEIQPLKGRDFGITASTTTNWVGNMIVGATFLTMLEKFGNANTFWFYAALNLAFILLTIWLVPETKHVTLEHIERNLMKGKALRDIGA
ncbi:SP family galactose:H+ symporter-like MFS transporter [Erwinia persicina]|jgi:SP family galactose:H+ symporter-like MFS transporter|uniref:sugar porter family MFS transporter n=1 Tax=Erwinia TaxID=551 RepID=UPI00209DA73D|nr:MULTISPECIES: sugar porter family MFS transporter [Erwinia]MCP1436841.1 SP family galactose:H+ symporter-like MFS transporter [Erwinia persicina]MDN4625804.1 sugar porter family MFS transporter [Erwinia sp. PsM31]MDN8540211.1 sugar porter family MFS transporter [Erwinia sp. BC051422]